MDWWRLRDGEHAGLNTLLFVVLFALALLAVATLPDWAWATLYLCGILAAVYALGHSSGTE